MFRQVDITARVPGRLLLHSMPGRYESLESVWKHIRSERVSAIVCLVERNELHEKSLLNHSSRKTHTIELRLVATQLAPSPTFSQHSKRVILAA